MITEAPASQPNTPPAVPPAEAPKPPATPPAEGSGKTGPLTPQLAQVKGHLQTNEYLAQLGDFTAWGEKLLEYEGKRERLVEMPAADASDEIKTKWKAARGIPTKVEEITFKMPQLPAGLTFVEADVAEFRQWCFDNEMTPKQAQAALELDTRRQVARFEAQTARQKSASDAALAADRALDQQLRTDLGANYEPSKVRAKENLRKVFSPEFVAALEQAKILDTSLAFKEMLALETRLGDTPFLKGGNPFGTKGKSFVEGLENLKLDRS